TASSRSTGLVAGAAGAVARDRGQPTIVLTLQVRTVVGQHRVDLPGLVARPVHPDLVLHRVTTRGVVLHLGCEAGGSEPAGRIGDLVGRRNLDPEMVQPCVLTGYAFQQHELQGWL